MKIGLCLLSFLGLFHLTYSQPLKGLVKDSQRTLLEGVNIQNLSQNVHTHSAKNGTFLLHQVRIGDTLLFSAIGFSDKKIQVEQVDSELVVILSPKLVSLQEVVISSQTNVLHRVADLDLQLHPVNSSQEILRKVPGLIIGQHAGGGKAEQIFLRGFDIDHGTDIRIGVDGLPVNMVSHAHGQGYADLHFLIPEIIERIDFGKGPYEATQGNFATAGHVNFETKEALEESKLTLEVGQFQTRRLLGLVNLLNTDNHKAYVASEHLFSDGPFESSQHFRRTNLWGKYTGKTSQFNKIGLTLSHFSSTWDASGQIPIRAVENGSITRWGAIDDTEGGTTQRTNVALNYEQLLDEYSLMKHTLYYSAYDFELYSNFTFFLNDPENGDQIRQKENRQILGVRSEYHRDFYGKIKGHLKAGVSLRNDQVDNNELSLTANRSETLVPQQLGDVNETNWGTYASLSLNLDKWTVTPSLRLDLFDFQYNDHLVEAYQTQSIQTALLSPKIQVQYHHSPQLQGYVKAGKGFHSNDTRVVVQQQGREILPAAYGVDVGLIWKPIPQLLLNATGWYLFLEQEFVYVGDAGIVEPSGKTARQGLEMSVRYQPLSWLYGNLDATYTHARALTEAEGNDYIPLAPALTLTGGLSVVHPSGLYGSVDMRHLSDRPANEDNSIVAKGYTVWDMNVGYQWKALRFGIQIQNVFDVEWNETQFATESRLADERMPVEEIHFTPGVPFFMKGMVSYSF